MLLGPGIDVDLGAIAKGDAADRACALVAAAGPCLVNAGGDVVVSGPRRDGPWPIAIATHGGEIVLNLVRGALATSGIDRRRWTRAGRTVHHAIDPRTGASAPTDLIRATAVAPTGAEADAIATALLVAGGERRAAARRRVGRPRRPGRRGRRARPSRGACDDRRDAALGHRPQHRASPPSGC